MMKKLFMNITPEDVVPEKEIAFSSIKVEVDHCFLLYSYIVGDSLITELSIASHLSTLFTFKGNISVRTVVHLDGLFKFI